MTPAEIDRTRARWLAAQDQELSRVETFVALIVGTVLVLSAIIALLIGLAIAAGVLWVIGWFGGWV